MEPSIYQRLSQVAQSDASRFGQYESQCRTFISTLRQSLVRDLGCPDGRVMWLPFVENAVETDPRARVIELSIDRRMALESTAYYQFVLRIEFEGCFVDVPGRLKKDSQGFTLYAAGTTYQVEKTEADTIRPVVLDLAARIGEFLECRFENFVAAKTSSMGFIRTGNPRSSPAGASDLAG